MVIRNFWAAFGKNCGGLAFFDCNPKTETKPLGLILNYMTQLKLKINVDD
jgi:hypothetical protein